MESTQKLQELISRQHDTISQLRQQLHDAMQQGSQALSEKTGVSSLWLLALLCLCLCLLLAYWWKRRQYAAVSDQLGEHKLRLSQLSLEVTRLGEDLQKANASAAAASSPEAQESAPTVARVVVPKPAQAAPAAAVTSPSFENIWRGKALYESVADGTCKRVDGWSREEMQGVIDYYRLLKRDFVDALENDYQSLSRNHMIFLILVDMGKSDSEIKQLMNITQTTIRSFRFRIKAKKKSDQDPKYPSLFF